MGKHYTTAQLLKRALLPAGCVIAITYFAYHMVEGPHGLRAYGSYKVQHAELAKRSAELKEQREEYERRLRLMSPDRIDPDYADELVRKHLGLVDPNEDIVLYDQQATDKP